MTATLWAAPFLVLGGTGAYAWCVLAGHQRAACLRRTLAVRAAGALLRAAVPAAWAIGRTRYAVLRARWAWRCRGRPPVPGRGEDRLTREESRVLGNLAA